MGRNYPGWEGFKKATWANEINVRVSSDTTTLHMTEMIVSLQIQHRIL